MKYSVWDPREDRRDGEDDDEDDRYNNNYTVSEQYPNNDEIETYLQWKTNRNFNVICPVT